MHPTLLLWVCTMHPKTPETVSPARTILARATSLVAGRMVQAGWKIDNGGRWSAHPSLRESPLVRSTAVLLATLKLPSTNDPQNKVETHGISQLINNNKK